MSALSMKEMRKLRHIENDNNSYLKQLDAYAKGKMGHFNSLSMGNSFNIFKMLHIPTTELILNQSVISNCLMPESQGNANHSQGHELNYEILEKLADSIRNPILILKGQHQNTIVVVTELLNSNQKNIIVPIAINQRGVNSATNKITSAYPKNNLLNYLNIHSSKILAYNKEKADKLFTTIGYQLSKTTSAICYDNSITYSLANVKYPDKKFLKGAEKEMTEQEMQAAMDELRKEFEEKFSDMEKRFNNLSTEIQTINKFVSAMTEAQGFEQTMGEIESVTKQLTGCEKAVFYCYDSAEDKFFSNGEDHRSWQDSRSAQELKNAFDSKEVSSDGQKAIIPLVSAKGETVGLIEAEKETGFTAADLDYFKAGSQIISTVELALNKEFEHQGRITDELTGLKNRQGLNEYISNTLYGNINADKPVSLVMCDIDHFKSINDTYGHDAGDTVLKNIAKILQDGTRSGSDCAFRFGGEEMIVIFNCEAAQAYEAAERLRQEVEKAVHTVTVDGQEKSIGVTISMGVHQMQPDIKMTPENARDIFDSELKQADSLLYIAKESGRNKVVNTPATEKENFCLFTVEIYGEVMEYRDNTTSDINALMKRYVECEGYLPSFTENCTEISSVEFAELEQYYNPLFCAEINIDENSFSVRDSKKFADESLEYVISSIKENGTVNLNYQEYAENNDTVELTSEYLDFSVELDNSYDDFLYHSSILNDEHIEFVNKNGQLPYDLNTAKNRDIVTEYINIQLERGSNLSESQKETLTGLKNQISEIKEMETKLGIDENDLSFIVETKNACAWTYEAQKKIDERNAGLDEQDRDDPF